MNATSWVYSPLTRPTQGDNQHRKLKIVRGICQVFSPEEKENSRCTCRFFPVEKGEQVNFLFNFDLFPWSEEVEQTCEIEVSCGMHVRETHGLSASSDRTYPLRLA